MTAETPLRLGEVDVGDGLLRFAEAGEGPAVILLHGWTLDHRMWQPQVAGLARKYRLVMPDRRGFGRSTAPPDLAREGRDVLAIADALRLERFALAGLSQGAGVALDVALRGGSQVAALILSGAPLPALVAREEPLDLALYRRLASEGEMAAMRDHWGSHPLMRARYEAGRALVAAMVADYAGRDLLAPSALPDPSREAIAGLAVPVLSMTGVGDTAWRCACARALAEAVPDGRLALIPEAGHLANLDNPQAFNSVVDDFLATHI